MTIKTTVTELDADHSWPLSRLDERLDLDGVCLRWSVADVADGRLTIEATTYDGTVDGWRGATNEPSASGGADAVVSIMPTGIGCEIGGYAGDGGPATQLLAACTDRLITNPNAVNGSDFISLPNNVLYTEGAIIDLLLKRQLTLRVPRGNRIGLVIDRADSDTVGDALNVANAVRAVHGVEVVAYAVSDEPIGGRSVRTPSGAYAGDVANPEALLKACAEVLAEGADAIAVTSCIGDLPEEAYSDHFRGLAPNPVGGVEAVISHLVSRVFGVPSAHAPLVNGHGFLPSGSVVDSRGAAEVASNTGLACVLIGLRRAPHFAQRSGLGGIIWESGPQIRREDVLACVAPATALGGVATLCAHDAGIPVIAVAENATILDVTPEKLGLESVIEVRNYAEAAGTIIALREGIPLKSIARPLHHLRRAGTLAGTPFESFLETAG